MVHALHVLHRLLKPNGILIDLRPAAVKRRVGFLREGGTWRAIGRTTESFEDDYAANRAVKQVRQDGLYQVEYKTSFDLARHMDTVDDFRAWLDEFTRLAKLESDPRLIAKVERAFAANEGGAEIVVRGPLVLQVLRKV